MINLWETAGLLFLEGSVLLITIQHVLNGYLHLAFYPWVYLLMVLFVYLQYRRMHTVERAAFGVKVSLPWREWLFSLVLGFIVGVIVSTILSLLHLSLSPFTVIWVWGITLVLAIVDTRLTCISYPAMLLGILQPIVQALSGHGIALPAFLQTLSGAHASVLLAITGLAHLAEGILIRFAGHRGASPLFVQSRRGQVVGAFILQKFWPLPIVVSLGGSMMPFPVLVGFSDFAMGDVPKSVAKRAWFFVFLFGAIVLGQYVAVVYFPKLLWIAALLTGVLHELLYRFVRLREMNKTPLFVRPNRGVRVLSTIPSSPAARLGLTAGDTIVKVGNMAVNSPYDIHFAIDQNPAYVKLEVLDLRGELRFLGTPVYTKDPHQLGIIIVPDEHAREYAAIYSLSIGKWIWRWWNVERPSIGI